MITCDGCGRHHFEAESGCPFCSPTPRPRRGKASAFSLGAAAVLTPLILAACYGGAPYDPDTGFDTGEKAEDQDLDGDGFSEADGDCDDTEANVFPGQTELCDDAVDNDCDALIDAEDDDCPSE